MPAREGSPRTRSAALRVEELPTYPSLLGPLAPPRPDRFASRVERLTSEVAESALPASLRESQALELLGRAEREAQAALQHERRLAERLEQARHDLLRACFDESVAENVSALSVQLNSEAQFVPFKETAVEPGGRRKLSAGEPLSLRTDMRTVRAHMLQLNDFFDACAHSRGGRARPLRGFTA